MIDNFEQIKKLLKFENEGDCYYLQLLRRQADDPMKDGLKDPKYHGNMHSRSIKDYFIKSTEHLDDIKEDIITLCNMFNVRAYIRLNKRNYKYLALNMMKHITEQLCSGETFSSPFHMVSSAAGKCNCAGDEKTWIIDLDKEYLPYEKEIKEMISECEPFNREKILDTIPTKNGKHLISYPFNVKKFSQLWMIKYPKIPMLDIHKDNPTILYVP